MSPNSAPPRPPVAESAPDLADWLRFEPDGSVTVRSGKVEVGQGIRTSLAQAVAEELRLPPAQLRLLLADTAQTPFDQGTFGSRTTATMGAWLRRVAAAARERLLVRAAQRWGVDPATLAMADGLVRHPASGRAATLAELTDDGVLPGRVPEEATLTPPERRSVAGSSVPRVDGRAIVTGRQRYTPDLARPGMLRGKVLRPPRFGATLLRLDAREAEALPGVRIVRQGDFVGVAAPDEPAALRALELLRAEWTASDGPSSENLDAYLRQHPEPAPHGRPGPSVDEVGSLAAGRAEAVATCEETYSAAYIAHAPLEPRAALAEWQGERLTVWTGSQRPFGVRQQLADAFGLPEDRVRVIVPDTGAAYGGKHFGDAALEAARLARAAGRPVKLVWTREEEFTWAYFRPAAVIDIRSAVDARGRIVAWECTNYNAGANALRPPYALPNQRTAYQPARSPLRQGSYRALSATANIFARETHIDELAALVGVDPLAFRLAHLEDARLRAVLEAAAARFGWGERPPAPGCGQGLACATEKGGYVACCAEVAVDAASGRVTVLRVVESFECGAVVNPDNLRHQIAGAVIQGLGGALWERIEFADGRVTNPRFSRYRVPRFADIPAIEALPLDRPDLPSAGAGETPITSIAPALGNAIFAASGRRLRALPLLPDGVLPPGARP